MDADSPLISRVERTFWTVWNYISGAVNRLLRPEPENSVSNNPNSLQESPFAEIAERHHEDEVSDGEIQQEQTLATASPLGLSRSSVAWDLCTSEEDPAPDTKCMQYTELKEPETDEDTRKEEFIRPNNDESQLLVAQKIDAEKDGELNEELYTHEQDQTLEYDKNNESVITSTSAVEETERIQTQSFPIPIKAQDKEEELNVEKDDIEIEPCTISDLRPKEEVTVHEEEAVKQRKFAEVEIPTNESLLPSGNENKSNEDTLKDDNTDFIDGESQMASTTSVTVSDDELTVDKLGFAMVPRSSNDRSDIVDENVDGLKETEGQKVSIEDEEVNKAEVPELKDQFQTVTGDNKEEVDSTAPLWRISEVLPTAETKMHVEENLKDVVEDINVHIEITETGDGEIETYDEKTAAISSNIVADENLFDKKQAQEDNKDSNTERVVSETGVHDDISEPESDENIKQKLPEVGDSVGVRSTPSPKEVENQEQESLQNSGGHPEVGYLAVKEQSGNEEDSTEESEGYQNLVGSELEEETQTQNFEKLVQETGLLSVEENERKDFESDFSLTSEKGLQDTEVDILVEIDEEVCDSKEANDAQEEFTKTENLDTEETVRLLESGEQMVKTSLQDPVDEISSGPDINKTLSLMESMTATGFLEQSEVTELQLLSEAEQQYAETDLEKASDEVVESVADGVVEPELDTEFLNEEQTKSSEEQLLESNSGETESVSDTEMSLSTAESGFSDQSLSDWGAQNSESHSLKLVGTIQDVTESVSIPKSSPQHYESECQDILMTVTDKAGQSCLKDDETASGFYFDSALVENPNQETEAEKENTNEDSGSQEEINAGEEGLFGEIGMKNTEEADVTSPTKVSTLFEIDAAAPLITLSDSQDESKDTESACTRNSSGTWSEEVILSTESSLHDSTSMESEEGSLPSVDILKDECLKDIHDVQNEAEVEEQLTTESEDQSEVDASALDFTAQRSRIAVKNPQVRPPKDPRSLILMPSLDPTPDPHLPVKAPVGGINIGIKLPGIGAGFPILKKTQRVKDETRPEDNPQQESEAKSETSDTSKQEEIPHKPKWMPKHPGFGNPLMSELKTRLNKTTKD